MPSTRCARPALRLPLPSGSAMALPRRAGGVALQPHRRARPRRRTARRRRHHRHRCRAGAGADAALRRRTRRQHGRPRRVRRAERRLSPHRRRQRAGRQGARRADRGHPPHRGRHGVALYPRLVIHAGADSEFTVVERFESADDVRSPGRAPPGAARIAGGAGDRTSASTCSARHRLAARPPAGHRRARQHHAARPRSRSAATTPACAPMPAWSARVPPPSRSRCTTPTARRCTTSARCRTTSPRRPTAICCSRAPCRTTAKSVYTGLIRIREEAKGSVAYQTNRNLTLSEGAWAESVPNLDIKTNDVKCSHASTVGPIDEEQRFYLESRGIPPRGGRAAGRAGLLRRRAQPAACPSGTTCAPTCVLAWQPSCEAAVGMSAVVCALDELAPGSATRFEVDGVPWRSCASATTCTPSATRAATARSRSARAKCVRREGDWSAGSTAARSASRPASRSTLPATQPVPVFVATRRRRQRARSTSRTHGGTSTVSTLEIKGLVASVAGKQILNGIDLTVRSGEVHAVMGPNGAGKSTLSAVIMGKPGYEVHAGEVLLDGVDLLALPAWQRAQAGMHLVMQYPSEVPGVGLTDMLAEAYTARGRSTDGLAARGRGRGRAHQLPGRAARPFAQRRPVGRREEAQRDAAAGAAGAEVRHPRRARLAASTSTRCATAPAVWRTPPTSSNLGVLAITHYNRLLEELHPDHVHILVKGRIVAQRRPRAGRPARARRLRSVHRPDEPEPSTSRLDDLFAL